MFSHNIKVLYVCVTDM